MKKIVYSILSLLVVFSFISPAFANEDNLNEDLMYDNPENVVFIDDSMDIDEQKKLINRYLEDPELESLIVLDESILLENNVISEALTPQSRLGLTSYKVNNIRNGSDVTASSAIASTTGEPGVKIGINQTKGVATTISSSYGASSKLLTASIGWDVTKKTNISISSSVTVPSKVNGKNVKKLTLEAYPVYKTKKYDVHKMPWYSIYWTKEGTGTVKKAYGLEFKKSYTYK
ncbi:hypothetical protein [Bacillus sp. AFS055030]|uniref:hypothetical protein n=1 Tax=Bacillus sp. AFS055030 TaxID=2033507 RepID=UPI000BFC9EE7|nr:hypothetical protein [Bacillus sp. AFS055030]PGL73009.1 hypothetical protein CN925_02200 [Bacillus sp. AFS055030]